MTYFDKEYDLIVSQNTFVTSASKRTPVEKVHTNQSTGNTTLNLTTRLVFVGESIATMNIFRFLADLFHLFSFVILLLQFDKTNSVAGISLKTQILYVLVFITRYIDLFYKFHSLYNTLMKIVYIGLSCYTVYVMTHKFKKEIESSIDVFPVKYIVGGAAVLAGATTLKYTASEYLWTFSIWLEAFAILPQLMVLQKTGQAENITTHYIFCLGLYRALYIPNWIYRYFSEGSLDWVAVVAGIVQTAIYSDFFYIYYSRVLHGKKFELPV